MTYSVDSRTHNSEKTFVFRSVLKDNLYKNIFNFSTAGDRDCVAAIERLSALYYSVDFIFVSFGIMDSIVEL